MVGVSKASAGADVECMRRGLRGISPCQGYFNKGGA